MEILLLEDDAVLADILIDFLSENYRVSHTYSMKKALEMSEAKVYDLYLFDINVADGDGISLLKELRAFHDATPTIFITAFHDVGHLKKAFEAGANDFIRKPFELEELSQRIENIKRHFGLATKIQITQELEFDAQTHQLSSATQTYKLSPKESACLLYIYKNRARIVSVDELLHNLWEYEAMPSSDAIRTIIKELRKYLGHEHIINIRGEGYRFE